jgi:4-amino-4-deoxy-L-arabinose transferase-like glycosyltransferase
VYTRQGIIQRVESRLDAADKVRGPLICTILGVASFAALFSHHPGWLLRIGVLGIGLLGLFFSSHRRTRLFVGTAVLALAFLLVFYQLGEGSLYNWDEAIYAQVSKEMLMSHRWFSLTWNSTPFFHKPPLPFWLTSLSYSVFGITEFAARFWSAVFAFGTLVLTFVFGCRLRNWVVGATAVVLLLTVDGSYFSYWYNFVSLGRVGMLETPLIFWTTLALLMGWESRRRPALLSVAGISIGFAIMTKAWVGLIPAMILLFAIFTRRSHAVPWKFISLALILGAAIALPWHVWELWHSGSSFFHDYVAVNLFGRISGAVEGHRSGPLFYFNIISLGFPFWKYFLVPAVVWALWRAATYGAENHLLLLIWTTLPLVVFSVAQTKLGWYISGSYPALALLLALTLDELLGQRLTLAGVAFVASLCCIRLPEPSDGTPEVKKFAVAHVDMFRNRRIYVASGNCGSRPASIYEHDYYENEVPPSLLFYTKGPITCFAADQPSSRVGAATSFTVPDKSLGKLNVFIGD